MFLKTFPRAARKFAEWLAIVVCLLLWTPKTNAVEFDCWTLAEIVTDCPIFEANGW